MSPSYETTGRSTIAPADAPGTGAHRPAGVRSIGVVGDTHLPRFGRRLPAALLDGLRTAGVELILHAGDLTVPDVVEELAGIARVVAVAGNNDPSDLVERLGTSRIVEVEGVRIGLTHGHAGSGPRTPERAMSMFAGDPVDVVVFGHSHIPRWERRGNVWLLNPGSPTDRRRMPAYSYAILEVAPPSPDDVEGVGAAAAAQNARAVAAAEGELSATDFDGRGAHLLPAERVSARIEWYADRSPGPPRV